MAIARWLAPATLATALGLAALAPSPAKAQSNDLIRTIVDIADVAFRGGQPYYRHGDYGYDDRLVAGRDRYGRVVYYRVAEPRYGYDHRYDRDRYDRYRDSRYGYGYNDRSVRRTKCNPNGKCRVEYYDPRHDRRRYDDRYYGYGR